MFHLSIRQCCKLKIIDNLQKITKTFISQQLLTKCNNVKLRNRKIKTSLVKYQLNISLLNLGQVKQTLALCITGRGQLMFFSYMVKYYLDIRCCNIPVTHSTLKFERFIHLNLNLLNYRLLRIAQKLDHKGNGIIVKFHQGV